MERAAAELPRAPPTWPSYGSYGSAGPGASKHKLQTPDVEALAPAGGDSVLHNVSLMLTMWLLFIMPMLTLACLDSCVLGYIAVATCLLLALGFCYFSRGPAWCQLAYGCLGAALLGSAAGQLGRIWYNGVAFELTLFASISSVASLVGVVLFFVVMAHTTGLPLSNQKDSVGWNNELVEEMVLGFQVTSSHSGAYPRAVLKKLADDDEYWSGEVIYDYVFHLANHHMWIGVLFCHPAHPYEKWERAVVLVYMFALLIFPCAAMAVALGYGLLHDVVVMLIATIPRNILKFYLVYICQEEEKLAVSGKADVTEIDKARLYGVAFLLFVGFLTLVVVLITLTYINQNRTVPLLDLLGTSTIGLAYSFVLEIVIDMFTPSRNVTGAMCFGFFDLWRQERDYFEAHKVEYQRRLREEALAAKQQRAKAARRKIPCCDPYP